MLSFLPCPVLSTILRLNVHVSSHLYKEGTCPPSRLLDVVILTH
jgi:hypothetical protein